MNMPVSVRVILVVLALLFLILPETAKAVIFTIGLLLWGFFGWRGSIRRRQLVSGTPTQSGGFYRMTVNTASGELFYTLRQ